MVKRKHGIQPQIENLHYWNQRLQDGEEEVLLQIVSVVLQRKEEKKETKLTSGESNSAYPISPFLILFIV